MHNLAVNFGKMLDICKHFGKKFTNEKENLLRCGVISKFSDLEVIALSLTAEVLSVDSKNLLFSKLNSDSCIWYQGGIHSFEMYPPQSVLHLPVLIVFLLFSLFHINFGFV